MARAVSLAPENLAYKFNLAVLLDQQDRYADAILIYRQLLKAASRGEQIPAKRQDIQARVSYLATQLQQARTNRRVVVQ